MGRYLVALALLASGGCEIIAGIPDVRTRGMSDDAGPDLDAGDADAGPMCGSSEDCTAALAPLCLLPEGQCVECLESTDCTDPLRAVCGADHTCRGCDRDSECGANGVCLVDGTCASEASILYAAAAGTGTACSAAVPCTLAEAHAQLSATKYVLKMTPGAYSVGAALQLNGQAPEITVAGEGATITATMQFQPAFTVGSGQVAVTGLTFDMMAGTFGMTCTAGALNLTRVTLQNGQIGMYTLAACAATFDRAVFRNNLVYGAYITAGMPFSARNCLFAGNGSAGSQIGALNVPGVTGLVEFSTLADNVSDATPAINCDNAGFVVRNSISYNNPAPINSACSVTYSNIEAGYPGGTGNVTMDPQFMGGGDYHLVLTSPMRGLADPATPIPFDIDGETRGDPADLGYDEVP